MGSASSAVAGLLLALGLCACVNGGREEEPPPGPSPGPPQSVPQPPLPPSQALNIQASADLALAAGARAVVVIHNGQMVLERYGGAGGATVPEPLASGTKSFTCALAAAAEDDGFMRLDDLSSTVIAPWRPGGAAPRVDRKREIRHVDLLSQSSGIAAGASAGSELKRVDSYAQAINALSLYAPGHAMVYGPNSFQAFAAAFELSTGGSVDPGGSVTGGRDPVSYLQTRVFDRLGVVPGDWERDTKGKPNFGGGARLTAGEWARYGQLILQNGRWNGEQVLSEAGVRRCTGYETGAFRAYGLGWWLNRPTDGTYTPGVDSVPWPADVRERFAAGGKIAPDVPDSMFLAYGAGNMKMFVLPSHELVVVRLGGSADDNRFLGVLIGTVDP